MKRIIKYELKTKEVQETDQLYTGYNSKKPIRSQIINSFSFVILIIIRSGINFPDYIKTILLLVILLLAYVMVCNMAHDKNKMKEIIEFNYHFGLRLKSVSLHLMFGFKRCIDLFNI